MKYMELRNLEAQLRKHAKAAYALLPSEVASPLPPYVKREHIEQKAEKEEWRQVVMMLESFSKKNEFPTMLLDELAFARQAMNSHYSIVAKEMMKRTTDMDKQAIGECMQALAHGPFITHDGELHSVTGLDRDELALIAEVWPYVETAPNSWLPDHEFSDFVSLSVYAAGQTLNNILRYPHHKEQEWEKYISTSQKEVEAVDRRWHELRKQIINS